MWDDRARHNLPTQLTSFVGRQRELAEVRRLSSITRFLTLVGASGIVKTRLACQAAENFEAIPAESVWLVELAAVSEPALLPITVASALGVREQPDRGVLDMLVDVLRPRRSLLLLDNCEHLVDACAEIADRLLRACPGLTLLATSREPLAFAGETVWRVPSLSLPARADEQTALPRGVSFVPEYEAVRLFVERAQSALPAFVLTEQNAPAVIQICRQLDGIPLAIELAAPLVGGLTPEQIMARLDDRFGLLTGGSRTTVPRHQTLRAAIDWSVSSTRVNRPAFSSSTRSERSATRMVTSMPRVVLSWSWMAGAMISACGGTEAASSSTPCTPFGKPASASSLRASATS
jgi:predicted ATPase